MKNSLRPAIENLISLCFSVPILVSWHLTWPYGKALGFFATQIQLEQAQSPDFLLTQTFVVLPVWCDWIAKWFAIECLCNLLCRLFYGTGLISVVGVTTTQAAVGIQAIQMSTAVSQTDEFEHCESMLCKFFAVSSTSSRHMTILLQQCQVLLCGALLRWNNVIIKGVWLCRGVRLGMMATEVILVSLRLLISIEDFKDYSQGLGFSRTCLSVSWH